MFVISSWGCISRSGVAGPRGSSMFNCLRALHPVSHSHQPCTGLQLLRVLPTRDRFCLCRCLNISHPSGWEARASAVNKGLSGAAWRAGWGGEHYEPGAGSLGEMVVACGRQERWGVGRWKSYAARRQESEVTPSSPESRAGGGGRPSALQSPLQLHPPSRDPLPAVSPDGVLLTMRPHPISGWHQSWLRRWCWVREGRSDHRRQ